MSSPLKAIYRQGIVAVIMNEDGKVLLGQRSDETSAWQFPQGGIEPGESLKEAFYREVEEELGTKDVEILKIGDGTTTYRWPEGGRDEVVGQEHAWFLARFQDGAAPRLEKSDGCFQAWKWEDPKAALQQIITWKQEAFEKGLKLLGLY